MSVEVAVRKGVPVFMRGLRFEKLRFRCGGEAPYEGLTEGIVPGPIPLTPATRENGKRIYVFAGRYDEPLADEVRLRGRVNASGSKVRGHLDFLGSRCPNVQDFFFAERPSR